MLLNALRLRLTLLYFGVTAFFMAGFGIAAYLYLENRLTASVDYALSEKIAVTSRTLSLKIPDSLEPVLAEYDAGLSPEEQEGGLEDDDDSFNYSGLYASDLSAVFILASDEHGTHLGFSGESERIPLFQEGVAAAQTAGSDLRTIRSSDGTRIRILTYRFNGSPDLYLQAGKTLADEDLLLQRILLVLLGMGIVLIAILGAASWWIAGRSIAPAREAWNRQQSFVANASHEMRAPLTLLRASADVALRTLPESGSKLRPHLENILEETDRMNGLVGDLLTLSRLDAHQLPVEIRPVSVKEILSEALGRAEPLAREKKIHLRLGLSEGVAMADLAKLEQVLLILLDNACRHTPEGGDVVMSAAKKGRKVEITVTDSGEGIAAADLPRIFERFYRADSSHNRENPGVGLGLSIARSLMEAQHGEIRLMSKKGEGTTAVLLLPSA